MIYLLVPHGMYPLWHLLKDSFNLVSPVGTLTACDHGPLLVLKVFLKILNSNVDRLNPLKFLTDYLQDQLNERNTEVNCLEEQVHSLRLTLAGMENLEDNLGWLREELHRSSSECLYLMQELVSKELELQKSNLCIEKLEESISYIALESQCEIESMKLDIMGLEQSGLHTHKIQDETVQVKARGKLFQEAELQSQDTLKVIKCLEIENKELKEKLEKSETNFRIFCRGLDKWLEMDISQFNLDSSLRELGSKLTMSKEVRYAISYLIVHSLLFICVSCPLNDVV